MDVFSWIVVIIAWAIAILVVLGFMALIGIIVWIFYLEIRDALEQKREE